MAPLLHRAAIKRGRDGQKKKIGKANEKRNGKSKKEQKMRN